MSCPRRSSAAACTCTSTTPMSSASRRSSQIRVPEDRRRAGRPDGPDRRLDPQPRPEEGAVGLGDDRLGPHAGVARATRIDAEQARETLHILLKYQTDIDRAAKELAAVDAAGLRPSRPCSTCSPGSCRAAGRRAAGVADREPRRRRGGRSTSRSRTARRSSTPWAPRLVKRAPTGRRSRPPSRCTSRSSAPSRHRRRRRAGRADARRRTGRASATGDRAGAAGGGGGDGP